MCILVGPVLPATSQPELEYLNFIVIGSDNKDSLGFPLLAIYNSPNTHIDDVGEDDF